jgi:hypothetical protein
MTASMQAQTEWKDRYVSIDVGDQLNPSIARPAQDDFTVIVWEDEREGEKDIYAQKIDNASGLPLWKPYDGVPVCTASGVQRNPVAGYDSLGGVLITLGGLPCTPGAACRHHDVGDLCASYHGEADWVSLDLVDIHGSRIARLYDGALIYDGMNVPCALPRFLSPGSYFLELRSAEQRAVRQILLIP